MSLNECLEFINSFSRNELKEFEKFLRSPYFNSSKRLLRFYHVTQKLCKNYINESPNHQGDTRSKINKELIYTKLYSSRKYNDSTMRNIAHELSSVIENFLVSEYLKIDKLKKELHLLDCVKKKGEDKKLRKKIE